MLAPKIPAKCTAIFRTAPRRSSAAREEQGRLLLSASAALAGAAPSGAAAGRDRAAVTIKLVFLRGGNNAADRQEEAFKAKSAPLSRKNGEPTNAKGHHRAARAQGQARWAYSARAGASAINGARGNKARVAFMRTEGAPVQKGGVRWNWLMFFLPGACPSVGAIIVTLLDLCRSSSCGDVDVKSCSADNGD